MTPKRWQQIKEVLHAAMQLEPTQRSGYLDRTCSSDLSLRQEVESLLVASENVRSSFLESPPLQGESFGKGTKLGPYEIVSAIGAGGMGEVYRGHDPRLDRDVAIKVLPHIFSSDPDRLCRFEQEARAAAALNHPNILAVHDFGTTEQSTPYVVSELLEGETLRECLKRGPLPGRKTIALALQIASGLAAAHDRGIVHRDLKPENLFLTKDGRIKILDFGIAKLTRRENFSSHPSTMATEAWADVPMGTPGYMSPEQVRGQPVDHRSDIFAMGAVVYEMLSRKRAFYGSTAADTMSATLSRDPADLLLGNPTIPPALDRVVRRCLEKNPDERFHSVRDVAFALEAISDAPTPAAAIADVQAPPAAAPQRVLEVPPKRLRVYLSLAAAVAVSVAVGALFRGLQRRAPAQSAWDQLTNFPDSVTSPALSPDGRMLAFLHGPDPFGSTGDIYLRLLPQGGPVQLTHNGQLKAVPVFSPDGSRIAFTVPPTWDTWVVPVLGGEPQLMLANASGLTWVDDRHILFSELKSGVHMAIVTATESRAEERDVYVPAQEVGMAHRSYLSPDHKWVLVAEMGRPLGWMPCRLVPFDGSSPGKPVGPAGAACTNAAWSPDGKWMVFSSAAGGAFHIWRQRFPDGEPEQLTFGPTEEEGIAVAPAGESLVTSVGLTSSTVWVHDRSSERQISFEGSAGFPMPQLSSRAIFSPDGTKLYFLGKQVARLSRGLPESSELWVAGLDSGRCERLLPGISIAGSYDVSADGKQIVFDSLDPGGEPHLWVASLDHRSPARRLESGSPESGALFGPASDLFFGAQEGASTYLYRRALDGSGRRKVIPNPITGFETISPDGEWVVAETPIVGEELTRGTTAYRVRDGAEKRICYSLCVVRWTLDGKSLYISPFGAGHSSSIYKTFVIPLQHGRSFPDLPPAGIKSESDLARLPGVEVINDLARPGLGVSHYAFERTTVHRNIYRIPIP